MFKTICCNLTKTSLLLCAIVFALQGCTIVDSQNITMVEQDDGTFVPVAGPRVYRPALLF